MTITVGDRVLYPYQGGRVGVVVAVISSAPLLRDDCRAMPILNQVRVELDWGEGTIEVDTARCLKIKSETS